MDQFSQYRENSDDSDASDDSDNNFFISKGVAEYKIVLNRETLSDDEDSLLPTIKEEEEAPRVVSNSRFNSISSRILTLIRIRDIGKDIDFKAI